MPSKALDVINDYMFGPVDGPPVLDEDAIRAFLRTAEANTTKTWRRWLGS